MTALRRPETEAMRRPDQTSVQTRKGLHRTERTPVQHTELRLTKHWILFGGSQQAAFYEHLSVLLIQQVNMGSHAILCVSRGEGAPSKRQPLHCRLLFILSGEEGNPH